MNKRERVIVIEDEPAVGNLICTMFRELGHRAEHALVPDRAFQIIKEAERSSDPFTVASIDKFFQVGQKRSEFALGDRVSKYIKWKYPYIATVMITHDEHDPQEVLNLRDEFGVDQFLQKDGLQIDTLRAAVERATNRVNQEILNGQIRYEPSTTPKRYDHPDVIKCKPIFGVPRRASSFDCDVFMIMPFAEAFKPIYTDHIVPVIESFDYTIKRGDDFFTKHDIMTEVWSALYSSKFVIADCSGHNANVFYELGMAHTLGKPAIMLTQTLDHIPFDIRHRRVIRYQNTPQGMADLKTNLHKAVSQLVKKK